MGILADGKKALVAEVKHRARNYDHKAFKEKVKHVKEAILAKYEIETRLFTLDDM